MDSIDIKNFVSNTGYVFDNISLSYQMYGQKFGDSPIILVNHSLTGNSSMWCFRVGREIWKKANASCSMIQPTLAFINDLFWPDMDEFKKANFEFQIIGKLVKTLSTNLEIYM